MKNFKSVLSIFKMIPEFSIFQKFRTLDFWKIVISPFILDTRAGAIIRGVASFADSLRPLREIFLATGATIIRINAGKIKAYFFFNQCHYNGAYFKF
jgi:hypothetical protein